LFIVVLKSPVNFKLGGKDSGAKKIKMGYWLILLYLSMLPCFLVVLLCGERDIFQGTFVQKLHNFISGGACDYFQKVVGFCCGERGEQACAKAEDFCCDRPNPILQVPHQLSFP
jgi:hypothetical protein